ncbi:MAG TPA: PAS domain S-box protein, partial [Telluria sp.]
MRKSGRALRAAMFLVGVASGAALARAANGGRGPRLLRNRSPGIIENASDAIISTDESQHIVLANPSAAAMFATTVADMQGSPLNRFINPDPLLLAGGGTAPAVSAWFSAGRSGRRATDYAITGVRASGETFPLEGSVSTSTDSGDSLYTIILRDVTERQLVQEKLSRSHAQLRQLSAALQTIREEERTHIARELHDDLGQLLASLRMDLTLLQQQPGASSDALRLMKGME